MAITSFGYPSTIEDSDWAQYIPFASRHGYGVVGATDWRVQVGTGERQVLIGAGTGFGDGIVDHAASDETIALDAIASGTRWDLVVARRSWDSSLTTFDSIIGGATRAIPARDATPGDAVDHPIALCQLVAGQSAVQQVVDLRVWYGTDGLYAVDELVLAFLTDLGTQVQIAGRTWSRVLDTAGNPAWTVAPQLLSGTAAPSSSLGFDGDIYDQIL